MKALKEDNQPDIYKTKCMDQLDTLAAKMSEVEHHEDTMKKLRNISDNMFNANLDNALAKVRENYRPKIPQR